MNIDYHIEVASSTSLNVDSTGSPSSRGGDAPRRAPQRAWTGILRRGGIFMPNQETLEKLRRMRLGTMADEVGRDDPVDKEGGEGNQLVGRSRGERSESHEEGIRTPTPMPHPDTRLLGAPSLPASDRQAVGPACGRLCRRGQPVHQFVLGDHQSRGGHAVRLPGTICRWSRSSWALTTSSCRRYSPSSRRRRYGFYGPGATSSQAGHQPSWSPLPLGRRARAARRTKEPLREATYWRCPFSSRLFYRLACFRA